MITTTMIVANQGHRACFLPFARGMDTSSTMMNYADSLDSSLVAGSCLSFAGTYCRANLPRDARRGMILGCQSCLKRVAIRAIVSSAPASRDETASTHWWC